MIKRVVAESGARKVILMDSISYVDAAVPAGTVSHLSPRSAAA